MCHHEIRTSPGVVTVINAKGLAGGCTYCKEEMLMRDIKLLSLQNDRYEKALRIILQWDQLNPPAPGTDMPWLRAVVVSALSEGKEGSG